MAAHYFTGIASVECPACEQVTGVTWKATVVDPNSDGFTALTQPSMEGQPHALDDLPLTGHPLVQICQYCSARFTLSGEVNTVWTAGTITVTPFEEA